MPLRRFKISISCAYFSAVKTTSDFFNRIGRFLPVTPASNTQITANPGHEFWPNPMQLLIRTNAPLPLKRNANEWWYSCSHLVKWSAFTAQNAFSEMPYNLASCSPSQRPLPFAPRLRNAPETQCSGLPAPDKMRLLYLRPSAARPKISAMSGVD